MLQLLNKWLYDNVFNVRDFDYPQTLKHRDKILDMLSTAAFWIPILDMIWLPFCYCTWGSWRLIICQSHLRSSWQVANWRDAVKRDCRLETFCPFFFPGTLREPFVLLINFVLNLDNSDFSRQARGGKEMTEKFRWTRR